jgi:hypothetical protein
MKHNYRVVLRDGTVHRASEVAERVKQIETSLLKNKTTNGLFWQPIM